HSYAGSPMTALNRSLGVVVLLAVASLVPSRASTAGAEAPAGQMILAHGISIVPRWFDPAESEGLVTPFSFYYALHDALVKPMPGRAPDSGIRRHHSVVSKRTTMDKVVASPEQAVADVGNGSTIAIAGFSVGHRFATSLILALRDKGTKDLTLVCNSLGDPGATRGQILAENKQVKKLIAAFSARPGTPTAR